MKLPGVPFCSPSIGQEEIDEVVDSLRNGWLTTGPKVQTFEDNFARYVGAKYAVAVNSCTAALTIALAGLDILPGDEVIVPTFTFCAAANVIEHRGATPRLVDAGEDFQMDLAALERAVSSKTRAIMPVHFGGQAADLDPILELARSLGVPVIQDVAHAPGAFYKRSKVGPQGLAAAFSFYPSKNMTTGEGGMLTTDDEAFARRLRLLARFGINRDVAYTNNEKAPWYYEVEEPGYKSNMMDIQAAIGIHQLRKLDGFIARRREIAARYSAAFAGLKELILPGDLPHRPHTYHLYTIRVHAPNTRLTRDRLIRELAAEGIATSVHFIPLHRHPFYRRKYPGECDSFPMADRLYEQIVSLPLFPAMRDADVSRVIAAVRCSVLSAR